jgi:putative IMPACT (imprinted ancient) family translation regulator
MCILRELQRENAVNIVIVVTRYFWGIHLQADRFKNVIDACKIFFEKMK